MRLPPFKSPLRVALFADTFDEANGVATLSRQLAAFARSRELPFLVIYGGRKTALINEGSLQMLELKRGPAAFRLDKNLYCDPLLMRYKQLVCEHLAAFKPDLVHITGPGDIGFLGLLVSHILRFPLVASWHTNLHEYLSQRLHRVLSFIPRRLRLRMTSAIERQTLRLLLRFYRTAVFVLAPNQDMVDLLQARTGRPAFLMAHGVDLRRYRAGAHFRNGNHPFCIGYVGRLTTEKNVRLFPELERKLIAAGERNFTFLIVGEGGQQNWLRDNLASAEIPGVLRDDALAAAYERMDAFVFPSRTDTFGLVILEAMACGVPVIVTPETGKRVGIADGVSGFLSEDIAASLQRLMHNASLRRAMSSAAREFASDNSWNGVFEQLYRTYDQGLMIDARRRAEKEARELER